jgi:hypothetical protein
MMAPDAGPARLPGWMRLALIATTPLNLSGAVLFSPAGLHLRAATGWPPEGHPLYPAVVALFLLLMAFAYGWLGLTGEPNRLFITFASAGKASFVALTVGCWVAGLVPWHVPVSTMGDLGFALAFAVWLIRSRAAPGPPASLARR